MDISTGPKGGRIEGVQCYTVLTNQLGNLLPRGDSWMDKGAPQSARKVLHKEWSSVPKITPHVRELRHDFTWIRWAAIVIKYRVQEIAEVSFFGVAVDSVLAEDIFAALFDGSLKKKQHILNFCRHLPGSRVVFPVLKFPDDKLS